MIHQMNALLRIASKLAESDPIAAYSLSKHLRRLVSTDRKFRLELNPREKILSHPSDYIEVVENREGGWDWIHANVDGNGSREVTGWRLRPFDIIKLIDDHAVPGPETDEVTKIMSQESVSGNVGIPRGDEMGGGPTAIDPPPPSEAKGGFSPIDEAARQYMNPQSVWDIATVKLVKKAIRAASDHPELRPRLVPILKKIFSKR